MDYSAMFAHLGEAFMEIKLTCAKAYHHFYLKQ